MHVALLFERAIGYPCTEHKKEFKQTLPHELVTAGSKCLLTADFHRSSVRVDGNNTSITADLVYHPTVTSTSSRS